VPKGSPQAAVWSALKRGLGGDEAGFAFYHYPILPFGRRKRKQPDIALFHPELGMCVIECQPYRAEQVHHIDGPDWFLAGSETPEAPLRAAVDQLAAVQSRYQESHVTRGKLAFRCALVLPFVSAAEWRQRGLDEGGSGWLLFKEDLRPGALLDALRRLAPESRQAALEPALYDAVLRVMLGEVPTPEPRAIKAGTPEDSP